MTKSYSSIKTGLLILALLPPALPALQAQVLVKQSNFGTVSSSEIPRSIVRLPDKGFALSGMQGMYAFGQSDFYLARADSTGAPVWEKRLGLDGSAEYAEAIVSTWDNKLVAGGYTESFGAGAADMYLVKTDIDGDTLWTRTYGGPTNDFLMDVKETFDHGYILLGYTNVPNPEPHDEQVLIRTNSNGDTLWTRQWGDSYHFMNAIIQTADSGFAIAGGATNMTNNTNEGSLTKTDKLGNVQWTRTYDGSQLPNIYSEMFTNITLAEGGGYLLTGQSNIDYNAGQYNGLFWAVRTNPAGDTLWTKSWGSHHATDGEAKGAVETDDGSFIIAGNKIKDTYLKGFVVKIDPSGQEDWQMALDKMDEAFDIVKAGNNRYAIGGTAYSLDSINNSAIVIIGDTTGIVLSVAGYNPVKDDISLVPNPAQEHIKINGLKEYVSYRLYNSLGAVMQKGYLLPAQARLNIEALVPGLYILELQNRKGQKAGHKFIKH
jgi:hypothetical protein